MNPLTYYTGIKGCNIGFCELADHAIFIYYTGIKGRTIWRWDGVTIQSRSDDFPQWRDVKNVTHEELIKMDNIHEIPEPETP